MHLQLCCHISHKPLALGLLRLQVYVAEKAHMAVDGCQPLRACIGLPMVHACQMNGFVGACNAQRG